MAIIMIGPPGGEMRGSIGGLVYSRNSSGPYVRAKTIPTNPNTPLQQVVRAAFQTLAGAWANTLNDALRQSWIEYAAQVSWINSLGYTMYLSGFNHFLRVNAIKLQAGAVMQTTAPLVPVLPTNCLGFTAEAGVTPDVTVTFTAGQTWLTEVGAHLMLYASDDFPPSRNFIGKRFKFCGKVSGAVVPPTSPMTIPGVPWIWNTDNKVLISARLLRLAAGLAEPQYDTSIVTS